MKKWSSISRRLRWLVLLGALVALGGCTFLQDLASGRNPLTTPTPTQTTVPTPTPTVVPEETPTPAPRTLSLQMWVPEIVSPPEGGGGSDVLRRQLIQFYARSSGVQVQVDVKLDTGAGGIANLLTTASEVAPSVMPDVIVLNEHDLKTLGDAGMLAPLQDEIPADAGYYATALASVTAGDVTWAFPYVAQADQMAYRDVISMTPPISWTAVLTHDIAMLFPAAPADGLASDTLLAMYMGAGGRVVDGAGQATLDRAILEHVYTFFADAQEEGLLDADVALALPDAASCWQMYQEGQSQLTPVSVSAFWLGSHEGSLPGWAPTPEGEPVTILRTWGVAIVTEDPARRAAALDLIRWLVSADNMAEMAAAGELLPTRRQAVTIWAGSPEGSAFVDTLVGGSVLSLPSTVDVPVRRALQAGLTALLQHDVDSPESAASAALTNLRR